MVMIVTSQSQNQREFFRLPIQMETKFKILNPGEQDFDIFFLKGHDGLLVDLSGGGAAIVSKVFTAPGTRLRLKLSNLGSHLSPVESIVVRADSLPDGKYKTAVKFVNISDDDVKIILNYLNQQLLKQTRKSKRF